LTRPYLPPTYFLISLLPPATFPLNLQFHFLFWKPFSPTPTGRFP